MRGVSMLLVPRTPWSKPEPGNEKPMAEQPPAVTVESGWPRGHQHLPMLLLKDKNLRQRSKMRAGSTLVSSITTSHTCSPPLLMSGEETHVPWDTGGLMLLPVDNEGKRQLVLVSR
ncbi:hypothetical protein llap_20750 [Limosa lapponica baueri]|uniref:Uncharacterized protein n=1 Tax=Limosa lapponica baueri TaxID=1758121 RepID=A0A2I0T566_LIMLA|nr:hypothetical protein llap_20750 [Limosa lapponica baueri]